MIYKIQSIALHIKERYMCRKNGKITFQTCLPFFPGSLKNKHFHANAERSDFPGGSGGRQPPGERRGRSGGWGRKPPPMCPQDPRGNFGFGGRFVTHDKKETPIYLRFAFTLWVFCFALPVLDFGF